MLAQSQVLQPNLFIFSGDGAKITYSSKEQSHLDFEDSEGGKTSFSGNEIRVENTSLGKLVTVTLDLTTDAGSTSLTLLIPRIRLTGLGSTPQPIQTVAIKADRRGPNAGHDAIVEIYKLQGTAESR
ncbi:hypothetical protein [Nostoc sphaeroides]|uniref:Uncharacterized protein n=1 Tax=Nostoc sphaeroides CCNUC1 TaxID=2653204 RepID=A0A5P8WEY4_9NOSO|nr:hypothetical protein [Nostoc sphaeroides]QFS51383.1 hypothetical protein GXM_08877 [Nostoc sphaeroides CCNUC1]